MTGSFRPSRTDSLWLAGAGLPLILIFYAIHRLGTGQTESFLMLYALAFACYFFVIIRFRSVRGGKILVVLLAVAALSRITLLADAPLLDDDIYRYLWDGKVSSEGINPYKYPPDHPKLFFLRDKNYYRVRFRQVGTVYPPLSQLCFFLPYLNGSWNNKLLAFKIIVFLFDLGIIVSLWYMLPRLGIPPGFTLIYAWSPLAIKEFANSGHLDAVPAFFLLWAVFTLLKKKPEWAAVLLALSFLAKFYAAILIPFLYPRLRKKGTAIFLLLILAAYLPFISAGSGLYSGLLTYFRYWEFNASIYALFSWGFQSGLGARGGGYLLLFWLGWALFYRFPGSPEQLPGRTAALIGFWILVSPVLNPWYLLSFLPLLALSPWKSWLYLSAASNLSYVYYLGHKSHQALILLEYIPFFLLFLYELQVMTSPEASRPVVFPTS